MRSVCTYQKKKRMRSVLLENSINWPIIVCVNLCQYLSVACLMQCGLWNDKHFPIWIVGKIPQWNEASLESWGFSSFCRGKSKHFGEETKSSFWKHREGEKAFPTGDWTVEKRIKAFCF